MVKIQCLDNNVFRSIQRHLTNSNIDFYTFSLFEEKDLRIVIEGVLRNITEGKVKGELEIQGYEVIRVRYFRKPENRQPIHKVILKNFLANKGIFNLNSLFFMRIKTER